MKYIVTESNLTCLVFLVFLLWCFLCCLLLVRCTYTTLYVVFLCVGSALLLQCKTACSECVCLFTCLLWYFCTGEALLLCIFPFLFSFMSVVLCHCLMWPGLYSLLWPSRSSSLLLDLVLLVSLQSCGLSSRLFSCFLFAFSVPDSFGLTDLSGILGEVSCWSFVFLPRFLGLMFVICPLRFGGVCMGIFQEVLGIDVNWMEQSASRLPG